MDISCRMRTNDITTKNSHTEIDTKAIESIDPPDHLVHPFKLKPPLLDCFPLFNEAFSRINTVNLQESERLSRERTPHHTHQQPINQSFATRKSTNVHRFVNSRFLFSLTKFAHLISPDQILLDN